MKVREEKERRKGHQDLVTGQVLTTVKSKCLGKRGGRSQDLGDRIKQKTK